jgi:hypothetical protein
MRLVCRQHVCPDAEVGIIYLEGELIIEHALDCPVVSDCLATLDTKGREGLCSFTGLNGNMTG